MTISVAVAVVSITPTMVGITMTAIIMTEISYKKNNREAQTGSRLFYPIKKYQRYSC